MKILAYSTTYYINNSHLLKKITRMEHDLNNYNGSWIFFDDIEKTSCILDHRDCSSFLNNIMTYIIYYQNDKNAIWFIEYSLNNSNYIKIDVFIDIDILEKLLVYDKLKRKHEYLIYMLTYTHKLEYSYEIDNFNENWKNVHIPETKNNLLEQPSLLKLNLYNYQLRTLNWMINIENNRDGFDYDITISLYDILKNKISEDKIDIINRLKKIRINLLNKKVFYKKKELYKMYVDGGILSDEMGLGKTITTISLILANTISINNYEKVNGLFKTKANLIICPSHLTKQWVREINKACPILKTILCLTKPMHDKLTYRDIMDADIVIVSFQFLCNARYYLQQNTDQHITLARMAQSYIKKIRDSDLQNHLEIINELPLDDQLNCKAIQFEFFNWHRLIIDEGHEIFGNMSSYGSNENYVLGKLIMDFKATFRWYITGTPFINDKGFDNSLKYIGWKTIISNDIELDYMTLCNKGIYKNIFRDNIMKKIYYRNTKESVGDEYNIPSISDNVVLLNFTDLEKSIYKNYQKQGYDELYLRQLCCHPQMSDRDRDVYDEEGLSLEEVRQSLIKHNQKQLTSKINKLNQLHLDKEQFDYKGKVTRCKNKINQCKYMIDLFTKIDPIVPVQQDETCSICLCEFEDLIITECGHFYCKECIQTSLSTSNKNCPMCREKLTMKQIHPIIKKGNNIEGIDKLSAKYGTKMGRLISICKKLFNDSNNRIIIFSQWDRMLNLIIKTLYENEINTVSCKGNVHQRNCAIEAFKKGKKGSDIVRVIMLSLENAASGINLTEATHIILIDPISGSKEEAYAIENQAIARACRLGQNKSIKIIRLIIKDTIEHELYKRNINETSKIYNDINKNNKIEQFINEL
jgi:SNF2 family DNA or RNA helicase